MYVERTAIVLRRRARWIARQAALVTVGVVTYFGVRGLTEGAPDVALDHARDIVALEEAMGIHVESDLQAWVAPSASLETLANWVYIWGHWPAIILTMVALAWRSRDRFLRLRDGMVVSGAIGMAVFAFYPVTPPRLAGLGLVDTMSKKSEAYRFLQPPAFVNQYAAMPSLHSGWDLLVGIAIVSAASGVVLRIVGFVMPTLMGFAVVATANHFVLDVVAGVTLVLIAHACALALERRRRARRSP